MWRTELINSTKQYLIITIFYGLFVVALMIALADTYLDFLSTTCALLLTFEWWRGCCFCKTIRRELAIFYDINELYFARQRWLIVKRPLFFRCAVVINIISKRNGEWRILWLMNDSFSRQDWRSLNYYLRQFITL
ncbi:protein YgfX [Orbus wheelerorum]|uniref:protein YgfX n=1 Tax=Orbus wheelerorum TaxID=3074111 RepID=UPI00370D066C